MRNLFGIKLRKLRQFRGLSANELARRLGHASHSYVSDIEQGAFVPPKKKLKQLAKALEVPEVLLEDMALEARIEALGIQQPELVSMFKDLPKLSQRDKRAIIATYQTIKRKHGTRGG